MKINERSSEKHELRRSVKASLRALSAQRRKEDSARIVDRLMGSLGAISEGGLVLTYAAMPSEVNVWEIIQKCPHLRYALPRVLGEGEMLECREFANAEQDLCEGTYGIREPDPDKCPLVSLAEIKAIILPGLAFDKQGGRLGKGGGYYDRLLEAAHPEALRVGVCFECQLTPLVPTEAHDQRASLIITPSGSWEC